MKGVELIVLLDSWKLLEERLLKTSSAHLSNTLAWKLMNEIWSSAPGSGDFSMQSRILIVFTSSPQGTVASSHRSFFVSSLGNVLLEGKGGEGCRHCSLQQFAAVLHLLLFWAGLWPGHISGLTLLHCEAQPEWGSPCEKWGQSKLQQPQFPIFSLHASISTPQGSIFMRLF